MGWWQGQGIAVPLLCEQCFLRMPVGCPIFCRILRILDGVEMDLQRIVQSLTSLTVQQQAIALSKLGANLTVCARDAYPRATPALALEERLLRMQGFNELQHQISQHIAALLQGKKRYPEDVLCSGLLELAEKYHVLKELEWAIGHSKLFRCIQAE